MASVKREKSGRYRASYRDHADLDGKGEPKCRSFYRWALDEQGNRIVKLHGNAERLKTFKDELLREACRLEAESRARRARERQGYVPPPPGKHNLLDCLQGSMFARPCYSGKSKAICQARRELKRLETWVQANYPSACFEDFSPALAMEYLRTLGEFSLSSIRTFISVIRSAWRIQQQAFDIERKSPWEKLIWQDVCQVTQHKVPLEYHAFNTTWLSKFFAWLRDNSKDFQIYAFFYLLLVTGWRKGDVLRLKRDNVDMSKRTITVCHQKTAEKTGRVSILYLTDGMMKIFAELERLQEARRGDTLFSMSADRPAAILERYIETVDKPANFDSQRRGKYIRRSHTIHAFRRSCITILKGEARFNVELVNYIVGHSPKSVEERHYNDFSADVEKSTKDVVLYMESIINGDDQNVKDKLLRAFRSSQLSSDAVQALCDAYRKEVASAAM